MDAWLRRLRLTRDGQGARRGLGRLAVRSWSPALRPGAPAQGKTQYDRFVASAPTRPLDRSAAAPDEVYNAGRIEPLGGRAQSSERPPLRGVGAGTFDQQWRQRPHDPPGHRGPLTLRRDPQRARRRRRRRVLCSSLALFAGAIMRRHRRPAAAAVRRRGRGLGAARRARLGLGGPGRHARPAHPRRRGSGCAAAAAGAAPPFGAARGRCVALVLSAFPAISAFAETRIGQALEGIRRRGMPPRGERAEQAHALLPTRPDVTAVLAVCAARAGRRAKPPISRQAVAADPHDWESWYLRALVSGRRARILAPRCGKRSDRDPVGVPPTPAQGRRRSNRRSGPRMPVARSCGSTGARTDPSATRCHHRPTV